MVAKRKQSVSYEGQTVYARSTADEWCRGDKTDEIEIQHTLVPNISLNKSFGQDH